PMVGAFSDLDYGSASFQVGPFAKLFLFSDGAFEVHRKDGSMWPWGEFVSFMSRPSTPGVSDMDGLVDHVRELSGSHEFADDFSIVEFHFGPGDGFVGPALPA